MTTRHRGWWPGPDRLLLIGVIAGTAGVALAMDPGSYAVYGPIKGFVLSCAAFLCVLGLAGDSSGPLFLTRNADSHRVSSLVGYAVIILGILLILSLLVSVDRSVSVLGAYPEYVGTATWLLALLVGAAAFVYGFRSPDLRQLAVAFAFTLAAVSCYAIAQRLGLDLTDWRSTLSAERVRSTLGNSSNLGVFLVGGIPYVVWLLRSSADRREKSAYTAIIVLSVITLGLSMSRGAWVGALAAIVTWIAFTARGSAPGERKRLLGRAAAFAALSLAALLLVPGVLGRITSPWSESGGTGAWRLAVWHEWVPMVAESPLLGFGPGAVSLVAPRYLSGETLAGAGTEHTIASAHNVFLDLAASSGVLAAAAVLFLVLAALFGAWRAPSSDVGSRPIPEIAASLVGMLVALQFHFVTLDTMPLIALAVGLLLGQSAAGQVAPSSRTRPAPRSSGAFRYASGVVAVGVLVIVVGFGLLSLADRSVSSAWDALEAGESWGTSARHFGTARSRAPWEHAYSAAFASGAARAAVSGGGAQVADSALPVIERAVLSHPLNAEYLRHQGDLLSARGKASGNRADFLAALASYERALERVPRDVRSLVGAATCLYVLDRAEEAASRLEEALELAPDFGPARALQADIQRASGEAVAGESSGG